MDNELAGSSQSLRNNNEISLSKNGGKTVIIERKEREAERRKQSLVLQQPLQFQIQKLASSGKFLALVLFRRYLIIYARGAKENVAIILGPSPFNCLCLVLLILHLTRFRQRLVSLDYKQRPIERTFRHPFRRKPSLYPLHPFQNNNSSWMNWGV